MVYVFDRDDERYVQEAATFFAHIATCPTCNEIAQDGEGADCCRTIFDHLSLIVARPVTYPDYAAAITLCRKWLRSFDIVPEIDTQHKKLAKHQKPH